MDEKYYTPDITEFHVGFEYQLKDVAPPEDNWHDDSFSEVYSCREDIEWLGWVEAPEYIGPQVTYRMARYLITQWLDHYPAGTFTIETYDPLDGDTVFHGTIKNRSELFRIMQQIGME